MKQRVFNAVQGKYFINRFRSYRLACISLITTDTYLQ